jgi:hypothetical protein
MIYIKLIYLQINKMNKNNQLFNNNKNTIY